MVDIYGKLFENLSQFTKVVIQTRSIYMTMTFNL